ncbi:MAG: hypothetical protein ABIF18_00610 [archaeon]
MFDFLKKDSGQAPPDVGQEDAFDEENADVDSAEEVEMSEKSKIVKKPAVSSVSEDEEDAEPKGKASSRKTGGDSFQAERIDAKIDLIEERLKQFNEKFSYISESIGEIRATNLENEKKISKAMVEADKVIDVVREVKPESLRIDYQKTDIKVSTLGEKIESNSQFMNEIMNEINDLKRKSEVFVGTEGLMKLNEDIKKDLIETQKLSSKTKMQADKAQEIFMELRKGFAESQKIGAIVNNLDESYSGVKSMIEKLKLDHESVVKYSDYLDFKKTYGAKLSAFESEIAGINMVRDAMNEMTELVETSLSISRRNEEDIGNIGLKIGDESVKSVSDYESQLVDIIEIIEKLSGQISEIKSNLEAKKVSAVAVKKVEAKSVPKPSENEEEVVDVPEKKEEVVESVRAIEEKPTLKPSENKEVVNAVNAVRVADVPVVKPEQFLGKNIFLKKMEKDVESRLLDIKNKLQRKIEVRKSDDGGGLEQKSLEKKNSLVKKVSDVKVKHDKVQKKQFRKKKVVKKNPEKIHIEKNLKSLKKKGKGGGKVVGKSKNSKKGKVSKKLGKGKGK